jgi:hypothetical protein
VEVEEIRFLYYLDKGGESALVMLEHGGRNWIGKLYRRVDIDKNSMAQVVKQEL